MKRLYILTGKGGVGKTTVSLALTKYLTQARPNKKVHFVSFNREVDLSLFSKLNLNYFDIDLKDSTETYIARKLKSTTLAALVMRTPFFNALYNMIPSFGQMLTLGHVIDKLKKDPDLTIVMDAPASGHALSMFESTHNFKSIFGQGPLVRDIENMHEYLYSREFLKTYILSLPTEMATQEALDLKTHLSTLKFEEVEIVVNECLSKTPILKDSLEYLPLSLSKKIEIENLIFDNESTQGLKRIPQYFVNELEELVDSLLEDMESLE